MRHAYGDPNGKPDGNSYGNLHTNSDADGSGFGYTYSYSYSCLTHTDVHAGQSIHDKPDWRQHCARHDRHR
jgi:hypothetical protein